jgi:SAM-dependent methyltransferase
MSVYQSFESPDYNGSENLELMKEAHNYNRFIENLIKDAAPQKLGFRAYDFGAGVGQFSKIWSKPDKLDVEFSAIELDADFQKFLRSKGIKVVSLNDIAEHTADFIYSVNVLEHIENDRRCLAELSSKLRSGGKLFIYVPAFDCLWTEMDSVVGHVRRYKLNELKTKLEEATFRIERIQYHDCVGFFAILVMRLMTKSAGRLSHNKLIIFDRFLFPLSTILDSLIFKKWLGKNISVTAVKC